MRLIRLSSSTDPAYSGAMELYRAGFPVHEQRESPSQIKIFGWEAYHFDLICEADELAGILLYWETEAFLYVEHFCVSPALRGRGLGQKALSLLHEKGKTVILEIDPPEDALALRRKGFYERAGYHANEFPHVHPPYHRGCDGHPLVVMSFPAPLSQGEYGAFSHYLNTAVMAGTSLPASDICC